MVKSVAGALPWIVLLGGRLNHWMEVIWYGRENVDLPLITKVQEALSLFSEVIDDVRPCLGTDQQR